MPLRDKFGAGFMQISQGINRREYERLPSEVKAKTTIMLERLKPELQHLGFSLIFLGHNCRWKDLTTWKFLAFPENHYQVLIKGSKRVRPRKREDLLEEIRELYDLVRQTPKLEERSLEYWSKAT
ncbi:MAG TPA: hypothetical protein VJZ75_04385 [Candidatus Bathyarchaeia archaeon]|nr:hypothetical protein [Candidatus Bathyarchaeia archaeon]